jgi:pyrrolidone-carboxylate peptidase
VPNLLVHPPSSTSPELSQTSSPGSDGTDETEDSKDHVPDLVLHMGLAPGRTFFTLEVQSAKGPYNKFRDVDGKVFSNAEAEAEFGKAPEHLTSTLDCEDVWQRWNKVFAHDSPETRPDLRTGSADSVGLYLCGFVYYYTLAWFWNRHANATPADEGKRPVVFLHVPDLPTKEQLNQGVDVAIGLVRSMVASNMGGKEQGTVPVRIVRQEDLELATAAQQEERTYNGARLEIKS